MTDELDFEIVGRGQGAPFRSRTIFAGHSAYADSEHTVLVDPEVRVCLQTAAQAALPRETGGILVGRSLRDAEGGYTLVAGAISAPSDAGGHGDLQLSAELTSGLKEEGARQFPTCDPIGWWHSHQYPSEYSATDRHNQQIWSERHHVGILVFAHPNHEWARVYVGPQSQRTRAVDCAKPQAPLAAGRSGAPQPIHRPRRRSGTRYPPAVRGVVALALVLAAIAAAVLIGYRNLASHIDRLVPAGTRPQLVWACNLAPDQASYRCAAQTESTGTFEWHVNGQAVPGSWIVLPRPKPRTATSVELWIVSDRHPHKLGSTTLYGDDVTAPQTAKPPRRSGGR
jgi:proteasome lid subunit RPN8/RPN11